jgi:hypothetical protein
MSLERSRVVSAVCLERVIVDCMSTAGQKKTITLREESTPRKASVFPVKLPRVEQEGVFG